MATSVERSVAGADPGSRRGVRLLRSELETRRLATGRSRMDGRTVLITGGASGSGAATARELHRLGAEIVIGTRRPERYAEMARELGERRVHPFIVDITDENGTRREMDLLIARGVRVTDLVHCAAGGLEPIMRRFLRRLMALRRMPRADRPAAVELLCRDLSMWLKPELDFAFRVNFDAPRALIEHILSTLTPGSSIVFYSSLWSTFHGRARTPAFYPTVAASKRAFESWLTANALWWAERGVSVAIISGHVIRDTHLGQLIDEHLVPLLPQEQQARARSFFIESIDMVRTAVGELCRGQHEAADGRPRWWYVYGPGQVVDSLAADAAPLVEGTPLPDHRRDG
jgi:NAD(P)-dependent dehydrogenase (short-subunit alcohol dehydrogenase family)